MEEGVKAARCVGKFRVHQAKWYCPVGTEPGRTTYCEYCFHNGCCDEISVTEGTFDKCNCDCPHQDGHPRIQPFLCPLCRIKGGCISTCGSTKCQSCGRIEYKNDSYCDGCSAFLRRCLSCGETVRNGDHYLVLLNSYINDRIEHLRKCITVVHSEIATLSLKGEISMAKYEAHEYAEELKRLSLALDDVKRYTGKTCEDTLIY
jgi:hypothetical protein